MQLPELPNLDQGIGLYVARHNVQRCIGTQAGVQPKENGNFCDCHHLHQTAVAKKVPATVGLILCVETRVHKSPKFPPKPNNIKSYCQYEIRQHIIFSFYLF